MKPVLCRLTAKELPTSVTSFPCGPRKLVILNFLSLFHLLGGKGNRSIPSNRRLSHGGYIESRGTENFSLAPLALVLIPVKSKLGRGTKSVISDQLNGHSVVKVDSVNISNFFMNPTKPKKPSELDIWSILSSREYGKRFRVVRIMI